jgi:hypothetical protein
MSSILGSQRLEARFLPTVRWWATQWPLPIQITRDCVPFFSFNFLLLKNSRGARATGHYLRTVTSNIEADNHNQIKPTCAECGSG